jgi:hypothetical protein
MHASSLASQLGRSVPYLLRVRVGVGASVRVRVRVTVRVRARLRLRLRPRLRLRVRARIRVGVGAVPLGSERRLLLVGLAARHAREALACLRVAHVAHVLGHHVDACRLERRFAHQPRLAGNVPLHGLRLADGALVGEQQRGAAKVARKRARLLVRLELGRLEAGPDGAPRTRGCPRPAARTWGAPHGARFRMHCTARVVRTYRVPLASGTGSVQAAGTRGPRAEERSDGAPV